MESGDPRGFGAPAPSPFRVASGSWGSAHPSFARRKSRSGKPAARRRAENRAERSVFESFAGQAREPPQDVFWRAKGPRFWVMFRRGSGFSGATPPTLGAVGSQTASDTPGARPRQGGERGDSVAADAIGTRSHVVDPNPTLPTLQTHGAEE